jgi:hypothetical protein
MRARGTFRSHVLFVLPLLVAALVSGCSGTTGGEEGPVQVSSATPAPGSAPGLGTATVGGVTVAGVSLHGSKGAVTVVAQVTATRADELVSVGSNYTRTSVLPQPLPVSPTTPLSIDPTTVVLRPVGSIDSGATVSAFFTFRSVGTIEVFASYSS